MSTDRTSGWRAPLAAVVLGAFISALSISSVNVGIPTLMRAFGVEAGQAQWVVTTYTMTLGVVIPLSSWLIKRIGHKRAYLASLVLFAAGSTLCALSPSLSMLIAARIVQGTGAGILIPSTMATIYRIVPSESIGAAMGIWGISTMAAPTFGPVVGGYLVQAFGWHSIFWMNVPTGLIGFAMGAFLLPPLLPERSSSTRFDLWGFVSFAVCAFSLQLALSQAVTLGWGSAFVLSMLAVSATTLLAFIWVELRQPAPLVELRILNNRGFLSSAACVLLVTAGLYSGVFYIPILLQSVMGLPPAQAGLVMLPGALASALLQPLSGRIFDRRGPKFLVVCGMSVLALVNFLYALVLPHIGPVALGALHTVRGVGVGLAWMPAVASGMSSVPVTAVATASSMSNIMQRIGGALSLAVLTTLYTARVAYYTPAAPVPGVAMAKGMADIFLVSGLITLIGVAVGFTLRGKAVAQKPAEAEVESPALGTGTENP